MTVIVEDLVPVLPYLIGVYVARKRLTVSAVFRMNPRILRAYELARPVLHNVGKARTLGLAAEMSFWLFFALVPLAAVAGFLAARFASSHPTVALALPVALPESVDALLDKQVREVAAWHGSAVAPLAVGTFFWLASSGIHSVFDAIEAQRGIRRPWWKKRLLAIFACMALALGVAVLALLATGIQWIFALSTGALPHPFGLSQASTLSRIVRAIAAAVVAIAMMAGLYRVAVPREAGERALVLPGAVFAVALQVLLIWGYGYYIRKFGAGGAYQASLAAVGFTLMTLWLFSIAVLLGVEVNRAVQLRRS